MPLKDWNLKTNEEAGQRGALLPIFKVGDKVQITDFHDERVYIIDQINIGTQRTIYHLAGHFAWKTVANLKLYHNRKL